MREQITISVDADLAEIYRSASESERRKLDLLINMRLRNILTRPKKSLSILMDEISQEAQRNGMTPEILESILSEK